MDNKSVTIEAVDNGFVIRFWQSGDQATSIASDIASAVAIATEYLNRQAVPRSNNAATPAVING